MNKIFNPVTKSFSVALVHLDPDNWSNSYYEMVKDAKELMAHDKWFVNTSYPEVEFKTNKYAEIGYYIYEGFSKDRMWVRRFVNYNSRLYKEMKEVSTQAISKIDHILKLMINEEGFPESHDYYKDRRYKGMKYYKIDEFNRLSFEPSLPYRVAIVSVMFHHNDNPKSDLGKLSRAAKERFLEIFDTLEYNVYNNYDLLSKRIESLR